MGYAEIEISQVAEPEHSLIRVLYETIFAEGPSQARPALNLNPDQPLVIAHLEGNPLGFGVARIDHPMLIVEACGVLREYRRQGIGGRIVAMLAGIGQSRGCRGALIECGPDQDAMIDLACSLGFTPGEAPFRFERIFTRR